MSPLSPEWVANKRKEDPDFFKRNGSKGGKMVKNRRGTFEKGSPLTKMAGRRGGINKARNRSREEDRLTLSEVLYEEHRENKRGSE